MQRVAVFNIGSSTNKIKSILNQLSKKDSNLNVFNLFLLRINLSILDTPLFGRKSQFQLLLEACAANLIEVIVEADFAEYVYFTGYEVSKKSKNYFSTLVDKFKVKHVSVISHAEIDVINILKGSVCSINLYDANEFCSDSKQSLHVRHVVSKTGTYALFASVVRMDNLNQVVTFEKVALMHTDGKPEDKTCSMYKTSIIANKKERIEFVLVNRHEDKNGVAHPYILKKKHLPADILALLPNLTVLDLKPQTICSIEL